MMRFRLPWKKAPEIEIPEVFDASPKVDDWVREYVNSDFFMEFARAQLTLDEDPFRPLVPAPYYEQICEQVEKHRPEDTRIEAPAPMYVTDYRRPW